MKIIRTILVASIASMLVVAPIELAQAAGTDHSAHGAATKKATAKAGKKSAAKRNHAGKSKHSERMSMGCMMQRPMMSADGSFMPRHSLRMQWHHNMMMWHHHMMHDQSSMHQGS